MEQLSFSLSNAAGWAKAPGQVHLLAKCGVLTDIVVGSFTLEQRSGNVGGTPFATLPDGTGSNSLGMPNDGREYLGDVLPNMAETAHYYGKRLIVNIAGFSYSEYEALVQLVAQSDADGIELNLGCPNIWDGGEQKPIASYNPTLMRRIISRTLMIRRDKVITVKL